MTLSDNVGDEYNEAEDLESFWQRSNDHRTVRFINRSSEWLELKGTLQIGTNRQMTTTTKIPPRNTYVHRFAGKERIPNSYFQNLTLLGFVLSRKNVLCRKGIYFAMNTYNKAIS